MSRRPEIRTRDVRLNSIGVRAKIVLKNEMAKIFLHLPIDPVPSTSIEMTNNCSTLGTATPINESVVESEKQWNVQPSAFSKLCSNPIREIVDNIKKPATSTKKLIPLSLGRLLLYPEKMLQFT